MKTLLRTQLPRERAMALLGGLNDIKEVLVILIDPTGGIVPRRLTQICNRLWRWSLRSLELPRLSLRYTKRSGARQFNKYGQT